MAVTPYVNEISGNSISDDAARDKIDNSTNGLRQEIYWLSNAVNAIIEAITTSENHESYVTIQDVFFELQDQGSTEYDAAYTLGINKTISMPSRQQNKAFPANQEKKSNIF